MSRLTIQISILLFSLLGVIPLGAAAETTPSQTFASLTVSREAKPIQIFNGDSSHHLKNVLLTVRKKVIDIEMEAKGRCAPDRTETNISIKGWFLSEVSLGLGSAKDSYWSQQLYQGDDIERVEYEGKTQLTVGGGLLAGTVDRLHVLETFRDLLKKKARSKGTQLAFLRKDQQFQYPVPLRLEIICSHFDRNKITQKTEILGRTSQVLLKEVDVPVEYDRDPLLQAQNLKPLKLRGAADTAFTRPQNLFFQLKTAEILSGPRNLRGACPLTAEFRLKITGVGDGLVQLRARRGRELLYEGPEQALAEEPQEQRIVLPVTRPEGVADYQQFLQKVEFEVRAKPKSQASSRLYPLRKKIAPYLWQASCITIEEKR